MLKIQPFGGLGDMLREIALLPVVFFQRCGITPLYFHPPRLWSRIHPDARWPDPDQAKQVVDRIPGLKWSGEGVLQKKEKALSRGLRILVEPFHPGLFDPGFHWRPEDKVPLETARKHIVVQTHLEGLPAKRWPVGCWREVLAGVRSRHPDAVIHVLDPAGAPLAGDGITIQDRLTFPQAIRLVEQCSLLISVDSWSKYVAGWKRIPQVVIVPDQTPDYPQLTASAVWRYSFRGLHKDKNLTLLGLEPAGNRRAHYTFGAMSALRPDDILEVMPR